MNEVIETPVRVRYSETDQMGQAYYANYLVWFEAARGHLMRELGIPYGSIEADGFFLPVTRFWGRLVKPARYDDAVLVRLWISGLQSRLVEFHYEVLRNGTLLAEGGTTHISVDRQGRPVRLPEKPWAALSEYRSRHPAPGGPGGSRTRFRQ